jgi:hypothetical protein
MLDGLLDECDAVGKGAGGHLRQLEPEVPVSLFAESKADVLICRRMGTVPS